MKFWPLVFLILMGCQEEFQISSTNPSVTSARLNSGRIVLSGSNLHFIKSATPLSGNLSGYSMVIESKASNSLTLKLVHSSSSALNLAIGTVISFLVSNASASTTVNLTVDVAPSGAVMAFNLAACPTGWSAMDGSGGRPDARGRAVIGVGQGAGLTDRTLASTGGSETHTLTNAQMPAHTHTSTIYVLADTGDAGSPTDSYLATLPNMYATGFDTALAADSISIGAAGGGTPHNIMQPYVALLYCQKD